MELFGDQRPFTEPGWYQGEHSPYYTASHVAWRKKVRAFVEAELQPNIDAWIESDTGYPPEMHEKAYEAGIQGHLFPQEYGGTQPDDWDAFHELILWCVELFSLFTFLG